MLRAARSGQKLSEDKLELAKNHVLLGDWRDFDTTYLALATLYLGEVKHLPPSVSKSADRLRKKVGILFSDDIIQEYDDHLILDELVVASMIRFKSAFERATPLSTALTSVSFGCFFMGFDVTMPPRSTLSNLFPRLSEQQAADEIFDMHLGWDSLMAFKRKYEIAYIARD